MKRWWKSIILFGCLAAGILLLSGCMTEEDKARAEANVHVGRVLVEQYVEENYDETARILEIECLNRLKDSGPVPDFYDHPSDFVRASVRSGGEEFDVLINVNTDDGYDNRRHRDILESIHPYFSGRMAELLMPRKIEAHYYPQGMDEIPDSDCDGFSRPGIEDFVSLLGADEYDTFILYEYIGGSLDFLEGAETRLIPMDQAVGNLQLGFASFRDAAGFAALDGTALGGRQMKYGLAVQDALIGETLLMRRERKTEYGSETDTYPEQVETEHHRYARVELEQGIELVYDEGLYDVTVSEAPADDPAAALSDTFYTPITPEYTLHVTARGELSFEDARITLYFPESLEGKYLISNDGETDWNALSWRQGYNRLYYWFVVTSGTEDITVALYEDRAEEAGGA